MGLIFGKPLEDRKAHFDDRVSRIVGASGKIGNFKSTVRFLYGRKCVLRTGAKIA